MQKEIDIIEDNILNKYPNVLETLLLDQTTKQNIFWATDNYQHLGDSYEFSSSISIKSITGINSKVIMPRVLKDKIVQKTRVKDMAEVYTPSWLCNQQINGVDDSWFNSTDMFNKKVILDNGSMTWKVTKNKIKFPKGKTWKDYINDTRLEITCGEAPYIISRYDTTNGKYIAVKNRIGMLDRKLRVVNENTKSIKEWLCYTFLAYKNIYAYEFQGDSLLLARESLLYTFIEYYFEKFSTEPKLEDIQKIAYIISWNIWQMDGLKQTVPNSCISTVKIVKNLFDDTTKNVVECMGCKKDDYTLHNGTYCFIMNWNGVNPDSNEEGVKTRFVDLLQKNMDN